MEKMIVIGGVAAGMSAASKAIRKNPDMLVEVFTDEFYVSYSGCSLPYYAQGLIESEDQLSVRKPEQFEAQGIVLNMGYKATEINPERKEVTIVRESDGNTGTHTYDKLIIATGARPVIPDIPGVGLPGVYSVKHVNDAVRIREALRGGGVKNVVIIGGGVIGVEMAEALTPYGVEVSIVELAPQILTIMDEDMAEMIEGHYYEKGVKIFKNERVTAIEGTDKVSGVRTTDRTLDADMVIVSIGVIPNSEIARDAGIELGFRNAIRVNRKMETSIPDIYAAGDCATTYNFLTDSESYIPLGPNANKQGRIAGDNATGGNEEFQGAIGTTIFKAMEMEGARTGLSTADAENAGMKTWSSKVTAGTIAHTYPGNGKITVKLIMEEKTNLIVGGQIAGSRTSAKRIDVIAALIQMKAVPGDMAKLDLAYSPPFAPVWDSLLVAANDAVSKQKKR